MRNLWRLIVVLFAFLFLTGCQSTATNPSKSIAQIHVYLLNIGFIDTEYKIDLENCKLYQFHTHPPDIQVRDPNAENEGYQEVSDLSKEKVKAFQKAADKYGFANWNESYIRKDAYDGNQGGFTITFSDGTEKSTKWRMAFPDNWDKMHDAFEDLTGIEIIGLDIP